MVALDRETILDLISRNQLVTGLVDPEIQVSPNGVELSLHRVYHFEGPGTINFSNKERRLPTYREVTPNGDTYHLPPGSYLVTYNETIRLPSDIIALGFPRSSLLRSGVTLESAVWDAGYQGRSRGLLIVHNPKGFVVKRNARLLHLVFFRLQRETQPYRGAYQDER